MNLSSSTTSSLTSSQPVSRTESPFSSAPSINRQSRIKIEQIESSLSDHRQVRNVCILAHVDHGKTTLTDTMLASNGIISFKQAGNLRYMDSRDDEQERGITMQSSSITLLFDKAIKDDEHKRYAINIIDSPGHVDFSRQVVTATRICDGCLLLVDAVEGVCIQTLSVLRQARKSLLTPILVINKMDRLINELNLSTQDAAIWLERLIEAVNAAQASLFTQNGEVDGGEMISFDPLEGNVVFSSAIDGWAFSPLQFIPFLQERYPSLSLEEKIWGPYVLNTKTQEISKEQGKKNIFSSLILDSIWSIYKSCGLVGEDKFDATKLERYSSLLKMSSPLPQREMKQKDGRSIMRFILGKWIPLSNSIMTTIIDHIPDPLTAGKKILPFLIRKNIDDDFCSSSIRNHILNPLCNGIDDDSLMVAFISKMISVPRNQLFGLPFSTLSFDDDNGNDNGNNLYNPREEKLLGMTRIFHGNLKVNQIIYIISEGRESIPSKISELYIMMGRDLEAVDMVPYGTVCIVGLEKEGISSLIRGKFSTLSSSPECPPIIPEKMEMQPIVQVAVRPKCLEDMPALIKGLSRLCQADPCAESWVQEENGEYVLACAGELHLEQCLKDLKERYIILSKDREEVDIMTSPIMVPYRESINDSAIMAINAKFWREKMTPNIQLINGTLGKFSINFDGLPLSITIRAIKIPEILLNFIRKNKKILLESLKEVESPLLKNIIDDFSLILENLSSKYDIEPLRDIKNIWSIGSYKDPSNILLCTSNRQIQSNNPFFKPNSKLKPFESILFSAFQLSVEKGPIANEECKGICYIIDDVIIEHDTIDTIDKSYSSNTNNNLLSTVKIALHTSMMYWSPRLQLAMYNCTILTSAEQLGRVYACLTRRHARIVEEEFQDGTGFFAIHSLLPVVESFGFSEEIRSRTGGVAMPQFTYTGIFDDSLDEDPYEQQLLAQQNLTEITPSSSSFSTSSMSIKDINDISNSTIGSFRALEYMNEIRDRKGLIVERKLVQYAEKQRTLKR